jgi:hypothetical protein
MTQMKLGLYRVPPFWGGAALPPLSLDMPRRMR